MSNFRQVSEWKIWLDDVEGELAMTKQKSRAEREIEVIAREEALEKIEEFYHILASNFEDDDHIEYLKDKFEDFFNLDIK